MKKNALTVMLAVIFTFAVPAIGYVSFGILPAILFLIGYLGGLIFWLSVPTNAPFSSIKWIYWTTFGLFFLHRVEEKVSEFFRTLSEITGIPTPEILSVPIIILLIISVLAWVLAPVLYNKGYAFGHYLVWTFFASMGITELAHFIIPLVISWDNWYFPGMLSVIPLAPLAWWGMWRITRKNSHSPLIKETV